MELLSDLLQSIYSYKGLQYKPQNTQDSGRVSTRTYQTPRGEDLKVGEFFKPSQKSNARQQKPAINGKNLYKIKVMDEVRPGEDFMHSKTVLLDKFFAKMGLSQAEMTQRRIFLQKEGRNKSLDCMKITVK